MSGTPNPYETSDDTSSLGNASAPFGAPLLYKHSGKVPISGMAMAAVVLVPLAVVLGVIYSGAVVYVPFIKLRGLITLLYGGALGAIAGWVGYQFKFRSNLKVALMALAFALVSYYSAWAVHPAFVITDLFSVDFFATALVGFFPPMIIDWMNYIYTEGIWAQGAAGNAMNGWEVVAIWALEAAIVFGCAFVAHAATYPNRPFCEVCNRWTDETQELAVLPVSTADPAWQQVRSGNLGAIKKLQITPGDNASYVELRLAECPTCQSNDFLSAIGITLVMNDGNLEKKESDIFRHMSITDAQRQEITSFAEAMAAAVAELSEAEASGENEDDVRPTVESDPESPA